MGIKLFWKYASSRGGRWMMEEVLLEHGTVVMDGQSVAIDLEGSVRVLIEESLRAGRLPDVNAAMHEAWAQLLGSLARRDVRMVVVTDARDQMEKLFRSFGSGVVSRPADVAADSAKDRTAEARRTEQNLKKGKFIKVHEDGRADVGVLRRMEGKHMLDVLDRVLAEDAALAAVVRVVKAVGEADPTAARIHAELLADATHPALGVMSGDSDFAVFHHCRWIPTGEGSLARVAATPASEPLLIPRTRPLHDVAAVLRCLLFDPPAVDTAPAAPAGGDGDDGGVTAAAAAMAAMTVGGAGDAEGAEGEGSELGLGKGVVPVPGADEAAPPELVWEAPADERWLWGLVAMVGMDFTAPLLHHAKLEGRELVEDDVWLERWFRAVQERAGALYRVRFADDADCFRQFSAGVRLDVVSDPPPERPPLCAVRDACGDVRVESLGERRRAPAPADAADEADPVAAEFRAAFGTALRFYRGELERPAEATALRSVLDRAAPLLQRVQDATLADVAGADEFAEEEVRAALDVAKCVLERAELQAWLESHALERDEDAYRLLEKLLILDGPALPHVMTFVAGPEDDELRARELRNFLGERAPRLRQSTLPVEAYLRGFLGRSALLSRIDRFSCLLRVPPLTCMLGDVLRSAADQRGRWAAVAGAAFAADACLLHEWLPLDFPDWRKDREHMRADGSLLRFAAAMHSRGGGRWTEAPLAPDALRADHERRVGAWMADARLARGLGGAEGSDVWTALRDDVEFRGRFVVVTALRAMLATQAAQLRSDVVEAVRRANAGRLPDPSFLTQPWLTPALLDAILAAVVLGDAHTASERLRLAGTSPEQLADWFVRVPVGLFRLLDDLHNIHATFDLVLRVGGLLTHADTPRFQQIPLDAARLAAGFLKIPAADGKAVRALDRRRPSTRARLFCVAPADLRTLLGPQLFERHSALRSLLLESVANAHGHESVDDLFQPRLVTRSSP